jgi:poly(A) polymerase
MSAGAMSVAKADWFQNPNLHRVLDLLNEGDGEARIVGGAIRNTLMGQSVGDIDIATTLLPKMVVERAGVAGIRSVPTGIDHGTVTLIVDGQPFEITTLRVDVATDGRRAEVAFGTDWTADARRRDLTINGLYADDAGDVIDLVDGIADINSGTVRFIGEAETRIEEDFLRILRFFRFFAWYGKGRPDADGLRACARLKKGLAKLSAERVWSELKRLLAASDPSRALLWMRQSGVLSAVLPETEKWGIDAIFGVVRTEMALGWPADPLLRLMAMVPPDKPRIADMAKRLRLSKAETRRLTDWAGQAEVPDDTADTALKRILYRGEPVAVTDRLKLRLCGLRGKAETDDAALLAAATVSRLIDVANAWERPAFPLSGKDLQARGVDPGPVLGQSLAALEETWVESNFALTRDDLLGRL